MRFVLAGAALLSMLSCQLSNAADSAAREARTRHPRSIIAVLPDGRQISGQVAATTDDERLDLVVASERVRLTAHLRWDQVVSVKVRDRQVSVASFRKRLSKFMLPEQPVRSEDSRPFRIEPLRHENPVELPSSIRSTPPIPTKPQSIQIDARLASWDNDAQPDGLLLELFLLDSTGQPTIARGQLTATLTGLRQQFTGGQRTLNRKPPVAPLEQWNVPVRVEDFVDGRAVVKLPFRNLQPDRDLNIAAETLLGISFGVSSVGVLKASQPDVLIRHPSFFRDELLLSTGNRLLPSESNIAPPRHPLSRDPHRQIFRPTFQVR